MRFAVGGTERPTNSLSTRCNNFSTFAFESVHHLRHIRQPVDFLHQSKPADLYEYEGEFTEGIGSLALRPADSPTRRSRNFAAMPSRIWPGHGMLILGTIQGPRAIEGAESYLYL